VTDLGKFADDLQRLQWSRPAVFPHGIPRYPELRVHPAMPVEPQQVLRGLSACIDENLMQHRPQETFFECG
jgi:hypothetical protein